MNIEDFLGYGIENAKTREELCRITGLSDRMLRRLIEEARERGALIVAGDGGEGYYITDDLTDIARQYRVDKSRALAVLKRLKTMRRMLNDAGKEV